MFKGSDIVAINFADRSLEALQLEKLGNNYEVKAWSRLALEQDVIEDGKIILVDRLRRLVKQLFSQAQPKSLSPKEIVFSLPESKVFSESMLLPGGLKKEELETIVTRKALESIPVESELLDADYVTRPLGEKQEVFYAATYKQVVDEYVSLFAGLDINVRLIALESAALATAIASSAETRQLLILDIGTRTTIASVVIKGAVRYVININI